MDDFIIDLLGMVPPILFLGLAVYSVVSLPTIVIALLTMVLFSFAYGWCIFGGW